MLRVKAHTNATIHRKAKATREEAMQFIQELKDKGYQSKCVYYMDGSIDIYLYSEYKCRICGGRVLVTEEDWGISKSHCQKCGDNVPVKITSMKFYKGEYKP